MPPTLPVETIRPRWRLLACVVATAVITGILVVAPGMHGTEAAGSGARGAVDALPYVTAHRGDSATTPENTIRAFRAAVANGADLLETDVRLTADRIPVLLHDTTVDRTTDGSGLIAELTFAEVRALDAGSWHGPEFAGTRVPTFDELLRFLAREADGVRALIELKGSWDVDETQLLVDSVRARGLGHRIAFASFSENSLLALRESGPEFARALLLSEFPESPVDAAARVGAIAVMTRLESVQQRPEVVDELRSAGLSLLIYTLNDETHWDTAYRLGVDGIITDRTGGLGWWMRSSAATVG